MKNAQPDTFGQEPSPGKAGIIPKKGAGICKIALKDDPKGEAAANNSLSYPNIRVSQLQFA